MSRAWLLCGVLAAGCLSPRAFPCDSDADCTGAERGRCEAEGVCSFADDACESGQRYAVHAGSLAGTCTTPIPPRPLRNACVAGEPWPTDDNPCAAAVCAVLPACCEALWSEACVHLADQRCAGVHCGKWLAFGTPVATELVAWTGTDYAPRTSVSGTAHRTAWVDARDGRPRLAVARDGRGLSINTVAGLDATPLVQQVGEHTTTNTIRAILGVDADGDDVVELGVASTGAGVPRVYLLEQATPTLTSLPPNADAEAMAWADYTGDRVPDVAIGYTSGYRLLYWSAPNQRYEVAFTNQMGPPGPFRTVGWGDIDGDRRVDLVAIGPVIAVHQGDGEVVPSGPTFSGRTPQNATMTGALGDLDGDGRADVVAGVAAGEAAAGVFRVYHAWDPTALAFTVLEQPMERVHTLQLADVDDDGLLDVLVVHENGGAFWRRNLSTPGSLALSGWAPIVGGMAATWVTATGWPAP